MQIWKFPLKTRDYQEVVMPEDARILAVQMQNNIPCLWAEVDETATKEVRTFHTYGTGHPMQSEEDESRDYIGTYQTDGGVFVWHLYELCA